MAELEELVSDALVTPKRILLASWSTSSQPGAATTAWAPAGRPRLLPGLEAHRHGDAERALDRQPSRATQQVIVAETGSLVEALPEHDAAERSTFALRWPPNG